jgi:hypothetical protein
MEWDGFVVYFLIIFDDPNPKGIQARQALVEWKRLMPMASLCYNRPNFSQELGI